MVTNKTPAGFRGMRRLTLTGAGTATALVLLFSYRTSTGDSGADSPRAVSPAQVISGAPAGPSTAAAADPSSTSPTSSESSAGGAGDATTVPNGSGAAPSTSTAAASGVASSTTVGAQEMTQYGVVQVQVTITGGRITDVTTLQYPNRERRDIEINSYALPQLRTEVIDAQSAHVDAVSGATYTSEGYLSSLQSALDAAGFQS